MRTNYEYHSNSPSPESQFRHTPSKHAVDTAHDLINCGLIPDSDPVSKDLPEQTRHMKIEFCYEGKPRLSRINKAIIEWSNEIYRGLSIDPLRVPLWLLVCYIAEGVDDRTNMPWHSIKPSNFVNDFKKVMPIIFDVKDWKDFTDKEIKVIFAQVTRIVILLQELKGKH